MIFQPHVSQMGGREMLAIGGAKDVRLLHVIIYGTAGAMCRENYHGLASGAG